jgi:hypothetical protein
MNARSYTTRLKWKGLAVGTTIRRSARPRRLTLHHEHRWSLRRKSIRNFSSLLAESRPPATNANYKDPT